MDRLQVCFVVVCVLLFRLAAGCCLVLLCFVGFVWLHSCGCGLRVVVLILLGFVDVLDL